MAFAHAVSGWSYLPPQAGQPARFFSWTTAIYAEGGGRALIWWEQPIPDVIEVAAGECLMTAIVEYLAVRQMDQQ